MKILIVILGCLFLLVPCQAAENRSEQNQQQFEEVEKYISRLRSDIENYYAGQLVELEQRAQSEIRMLEVVDKAVYASIADQSEAAKWVLHIDNYGYRSPWYLADKTERMLKLRDDFESYNGGIENSSKQFAVAQSRIAERKSDILAKLEWETVKLEQRKQYALTIGLSQLEKRMKEDVIRPKPEVTYGMVTGILYSADKPSVAVDRKIVHEGDKIRGVTVVKIFKDKVAFRKNGRYWVQRVRQQPETYWK